MWHCKYYIYTCKQKVSEWRALGNTESKDSVDQFLQTSDTWWEIRKNPKINANRDFTRYQLGFLLESCHTVTAYCPPSRSLCKIIFPFFNSASLPRFLSIQKQIKYMKHNFSWKTYSVLLMITTQCKDWLVLVQSKIAQWLQHLAQDRKVLQPARTSFSSNS